MNYHLVRLNVDIPTKLAPMAFTSVGHLGFHPYCQRQNMDEARRLTYDEDRERQTKKNHLFLFKRAFKKGEVCAPHKLP